MSAGTASNQPFPATPAPTTLVGAAYELIKGQPFNNILTAALLASMIAAVYGAYLAIPVHLKTIQDGYKENAAAHERTIKVLTDAMKEERELDRKNTREMFDLIIKGQQ